MTEIYYGPTIALISLIWVAIRLVCFYRTKAFSIKRELQLLLVYICIVVVVRFTFFPFSKIDGKIQPLLFDIAKMIPPRMNFLPFVNLMDYPEKKDALINVIGNTTMFIPLGIVWPAVFKKLDTHKKVIGAGILFSLCIEILQLPFFDRVTDIDDLILNSAGFIAGYGIYLLFIKIKKHPQK